MISRIELSEHELAEIAGLVVEECESAFAAFAETLRRRLTDYPDDVHYRALAIGLIYMLANHLRHHAALTSVEETVDLAAHHLKCHISSIESDTKSERRRAH